MSTLDFMIPCDPRLFEYFPEEVPDEEVFEDMAVMGTTPEVIVDPVERQAYIAYLANWQGPN